MGKKITTCDFVTKAKIFHGDKYDYSNVEYISSTKKIRIICSIHGEFSITPSNHLAGSGCKECYFFTKRGDKLNFIEKSKIIHENKYSYEYVEYKNANTKVKIICNEHGEFFQKPYDHMNKKMRCPLCTKNKKYTAETFIDVANKLHNFKYDYSSMKFDGINKEICIICPEHGETYQTPRNHIRTVGCNECSLINKTSKPVKNIKKILSKYNVISEYIFDDCKNKKPLPFDLYIPEINICIEYDGRQHYEPIEHWGGVESLKCIQHNDKIKTQYCKDNNIFLLRIKYDEDHIKSVKIFFKNTLNIEL